ncbi:MAG: methyltransferase domain-containing protein [Spirochaetaceae bacterium]|jgi:2-polyprenyl-3-methyl-5-hydroxy-6-metoxy-1,4-benzoquinol methylase/spore coat polysaccharide biosynthesis predicted glycosyltransferase SpsG|nr:methyltransferase domain-containing protein [Spirochaetaceae bacterium]
MNNILVVASFEKGRGTGHLVRSSRLVTELRARGFNALLCIVGNRSEEDTATVLGEFDAQNRIPLFAIRETAWDLIVTDRCQTLSEEALIYHGLAPVLGIDEGGKDREQFDFLLDILHCDSGGVTPNERRPDLGLPVFPSFPPPLPLEKSASNTERLRVLVSFGGEDSDGLGQRTCLALMGRSDMRLTVVTPANPIPHLETRLTDFDLVITHYGLTAYEALAAGVPVLLDHPSDVHRTLAKKAGFRPLDGIRELVRLPEGEAARWVAETVKPQTEKLAAKLKPAGDTPLTLPDYIASLSPQVFRQCPVCGGPRGRIVARFPRRTYRVCPECGVVYMDRLDEPPIEYAEQYFFDFYKAQYGKTYIEDFTNLKKAATGRIAHILPLLQEGATARAGAKDVAAHLSRFELLQPLRKILDVGCAYGPFLQAAQESGFFMTIGLDPAESAVQYLKGQLSIFALKGFFPDDCRIGPGNVSFWEENYFDVITMWYVVEHITDVQNALKTVAALLKKGGVFAFSTPSRSGISGRKDLQTFLEKSPADHRTIWDPRRVKQLLGRAGFDLKEIVVTGHHPERFPRWMRFLGESTLLKISRAFGLGDTFEVYAVKR